MKTKWFFQHSDRKTTQNMLGFGVFFTILALFLMATSHFRLPAASSATLLSADRQVQQVSAAFTAQPASCASPCQIRFINQSQNAVRFEWFVNDTLVLRARDLVRNFYTPGNYRIKLVAISSTGLRREAIKSISITPPPWSWKRVTQLNLQDASNFLNGNPPYKTKPGVVRMANAVSSLTDLIIFHQPNGQGGWGWKRVTNLNFTDALNFLNGQGAYQSGGKVGEAEIVAVKEGSIWNLLLFYQGRGNANWSWKRVTNMDINDALNFLNARGGAYTQAIRKVQIAAIDYGTRTDLLLFYQTGVPEVPGTWLLQKLNSENEVMSLLNRVKGAEIVTAKGPTDRMPVYYVFYKM